MKGAHLERDKQKEQVSKLDDHTGSHVTGTPQLSFTEDREQGNLYFGLFVCFLYLASPPLELVL